MEIIERLESNSRRALVKCPECKTVKEMDYHKAKQRPLDIDVCKSCQLTARNKSKEMRQNQSIAVDKLVSELNSESNGLFIIKFIDKRQTCLVQCMNCSKEYEREYTPNIFNIVGCQDCRTSLINYKKKTCSKYYTKRLSQIYGNMVQRTTNPKSDAQIKAYLDKGIVICKEWLEDRELFYKWSQENGYTKDLTIDRRDNDKGYSPDNCRWVPRTTQQQNTCKIHKGNTSGFRGVSANNNSIMLWRARITANNKETQIGTYLTALEAAYAYDNYVLKNKLEHTINFP